jgi:hypothetical protein
MATILVELIREFLRQHGLETLSIAKVLWSEGTGGSADQRISGGWRSHGGAEARREQREESTTRPGGQLACLVFLPVVLGHPCGRDQPVEPSEACLFVLSRQLSRNLTHKPQVGGSLI